MMKTKILKSLLAIACLLSSINALAYDFEVDGFYYEVNLEKMTATLVAGENKQIGDIIVPATVSYKGREFSVTAINGAFSGNTELSSVKIPSSITFLGARSFENCTSLKLISGLENITEFGAACFSGCTSLSSIKLPATIMSLPNGIFYGCTSLTNFEIPSSVVTINDNVFCGCKALKSITIPSSIHRIGNEVFTGCSKLANVEFKEESSTIELGCSRDEYGKSKPLFKDCPLQSVIMGRNIKSAVIDSYSNMGCFSNNLTLKSVIISCNVTFIEEGAFEGCTNLETITIPRSIVRIEQYAFNSSGIRSIFFEDGYNELLLERSVEVPNIFGGSKIEEAYIGRTFTSGGYMSGISIAVRTLFPISLKKLVIGDYVTNIDILLLNSYKVIQSLSIYSNLKDVQFGANLMQLPNMADNTSLEKLSISSTTPPYANSFSNSQYMDLKVEIPEGSLNAYQSSAIWKKFWNINQNSSLLHCIEVDGVCYRIVADKSLEVMKRSTGYSGAINIPETIEYNGITYDVISIGEAFKGCSQLNSISIPRTVKSLMNNSFKDCVGLENITFECMLDEIPFGAFENCTSLSIIKIPETVKSIQGNAFKGCSMLADFICADLFTSIGESAFENCTTLTNIAVKNVASIGKSAFKGCTNLNKAYFNNNLSVIPQECFSGCNNLVIVHPLNSVVSIEANAFENCNQIQEISLPNIVSISENAFKNCYSLMTITLGNGLESIGDGAFQSCKKLESMIIPENVECFGTSMFSGCSSLKELIFQDGISPLHFPSGSLYGTTDIQKKEVSGKTILFKIRYYNAFFSNLPIEKLYIGRNLADSPRYTISGDGGVDYYLITSYDAPFYNLPLLRELIIGENVDVVGPTKEYISEVDLYETPGSFKKCNSLESVIVKNSNPPIGAEFSNTVYSKATLVVPDNTVSLYKVAEGWKDFIKIIDEQSVGIEDIYKNNEHFNLTINSDGFTYKGDTSEPICVYGIDGKLIYSTIIRPLQSIKLSKGLYLVKFGEKSIKVKI